MEAARALLLAAQGLDARPRLAGRGDVLEAVRGMGVLQIDSISVDGRVLSVELSSSPPPRER